MDPDVYPDSLRGLWALLRDFDDGGLSVRPEFIVPANYTDHSLPAVVHLQRTNSTVGHDDRVDEVRFTVYGLNPLWSGDACAQILSYICGDGVVTPAVPESRPGAADGAAAFFFDSIEQRVGPSSLAWHSDEVFPVSATVDVRSRPISF